ncbi:hypothetical protein ECC02_002164 [Trypanosoma cruzi]|uniref:Uncharacterized protein n=1 Tax=Trypanosoma cruzi TaxID=5693 RepID=A0A7J6YDV8_TRYCR|nr:hypothetical protein ECC02_002164 [Trypanosoma cruzi]
MDVAMRATTQATHRAKDSFVIVRSKRLPVSVSKDPTTSSSRSCRRAPHKMWWAILLENSQLSEQKYEPQPSHVRHKESFCVFAASEFACWRRQCEQKGMSSATYPCAGHDTMGASSKRSLCAGISAVAITCFPFSLVLCTLHGTNIFSKVLVKYNTASSTGSISVAKCALIDVILSGINEGGGRKELIKIYIYIYIFFVLLQFTKFAIWTTTKKEKEKEIIWFG